MYQRILLFGYGTMASAMLEGWLASGLEPWRFTVYNPRAKPAPESVAFTSDLPDGDFDAWCGREAAEAMEVAAEGRRSRDGNRADLDARSVDLAHCETLSARRGIAR